MPETVSFRLPEAEQRFLQSHHLAPGKLAKSLVEEEVRRLRAKDDRAFLAKLSRKPVEPVEKTIRALRDAA